MGPDWWAAVGGAGPGAPPGRAGPGRAGSGADHGGRRQQPPGRPGRARLQDRPAGGGQSPQEVQGQAEREEAGRRGEETLPGAGVHQVPDHRLRIQGAGGLTAGDRPQRVAGQQQQHYWYDERGKKVKCTAPQYVDFVMSSVQKLVTDEDIFPTKYGKEFPLSFESLVKKICKYLFHVLAHIYSSHFKETLALELHGHLNTLYIHFILFVREFNLVDCKETTVMGDLTEVLCGSGAGAGAQNHVKER
uniref:MOB kinase activator 2 n=1 Tax=Ornithorhynchus anatinus TaxID=9258 RepID=A0A6I8N3I1_ORNAN